MKYDSTEDNVLDDSALRLDSHAGKLCASGEKMRKRAEWHTERIIVSVKRVTVNRFLTHDDGRCVGTSHLVTSTDMKIGVAFLPDDEVSGMSTDL